MKGLGIVFVVFAVLNLLVGFLAIIGLGSAEAFVSKLGAAAMLGVLGGFLISRANKKKEEQDNKRKWDNESK